MKFGIIGVGIVGLALLLSLKDKFQDVVGYDKYKEEYSDLESTLKTDIIFLCLPTPYDDKKERYDISSLLETCSLLDERQFKGLVVIESTVEPGTSEYLAKFYNLNLVHSPEFLSAKSAKVDFDNQNHIVIGATQNCSHEHIEKLIEFYKTYYQNAKISLCNSDESEMMKIAVNSFYAVKVQYFNELYDACQKMGSEHINFDTVRDMMLRNGWINPMHTKVPGTDGQLSYGGMCLPKDVKAFTKFMKRKGSLSKVLEATVKERNKMRDD